MAPVHNPDRRGAVVIPVTPAPEPADFDRLVRQPGNRWLAAHSSAKPSKFPGYWTNVRADLRTAFAGRCAYLGHWIPSAQTDHFIAKSVDRTKTYEWSNYRYGEPGVNQRKSVKQILDPFAIGADWVTIHPDTLEYMAGPGLPAGLSPVAQDTFAILNSRELVRSREELVSSYDAIGKAEAYTHLQTFFPLLAASLKRAGRFEPDIPR